MQPGHSAVGLSDGGCQHLSCSSAQRASLGAGGSTGGRCGIEGCGGGDGLGLDLMVLVVCSNLNHPGLVAEQACKCLP